MSNSLAIFEQFAEQTDFLEKMAVLFKRTLETGTPSVSDYFSLLATFVRDPIGRELVLQLYSLIATTKPVEELLTSTDLFERMIGENLQRVAKG